MKKKIIGVFLIITLVFTTIFTSTAVSFAETSSKYWVKVNAQANVVTVYKKSDGKWKPLRAMLCSTGTGKKGSENATPTGTFYVSKRWDWGAMVGGVYARYVVQFYGDYLFHSVPYNKCYDKSSQPTKEFNKLGKDASHGCVRLSIMDAKWVYNNIPKGTKVTIYNSKNPGPLGKPDGIKVKTSRKTYWDPTDPDKKNPYYRLPKPKITVSSSKKTTVQYGSKYTLKKGVTAKDPNTFQNLTHKLEVYKVKRYSTSKRKYVESKFSTKKLGTYKITYRVKYKYGGTTYKTIKLRVVDNLKAPAISGAKSRTVRLGDRNAVMHVTAKQASCDRTKAINVFITPPDGRGEECLTYNKACSYTFDQTGIYHIRYEVANKYKSSLKTIKKIKITCEQSL